MPDLFGEKFLINVEFISHKQVSRRLANIRKVPFDQRMWVFHDNRLFELLCFEKQNVRYASAEIHVKVVKAGWSLEVDIVEGHELHL